MPRSASRCPTWSNAPFAGTRPPSRSRGSSSRRFAAASTQRSTSTRATRCASRSWRRASRSSACCSRCSTPAATSPPRSKWRSRPTLAARRALRLLPRTRRANGRRRWRTHLRGSWNGLSMHVPSTAAATKQPTTTLTRCSLRRPSLAPSTRTSCAPRWTEPQRLRVACARRWRALRTACGCSWTRPSRRWWRKRRTSRSFTSATRCASRSRRSRRSTRWRATRCWGCGAHHHLPNTSARLFRATRRLEPSTVRTAATSTPTRCSFTSRAPPPATTTRATLTT
mmetsp:Transcript_36639/g.85578  ORF Transcript_36639/g.85578 Transcript_36639/m.85578 type:complete len:283 (-) Transcript_36639:584-1432(-)